MTTVTKAGEKEVFQNLVNASKELFDIVEHEEVERKGNQIYVFTPSNILGFTNWNSRGNNGKVNVSITFERYNGDSNPQDKCVHIKTYTRSPLWSASTWYGLSLSQVRQEFLKEVSMQVREEIDEALAELSELNVPIINAGCEDLFHQYVVLTIFDNDMYENALENMKYIKQVIEKLQVLIEEAVSKGIEKVKEEISKQEELYNNEKEQKREAIRQGLTSSNTVASKTSAQNYNVVGDFQKVFSSVSFEDKENISKQVFQIIKNYL